MKDNIYATVVKQARQNKTLAIKSAKRPLHFVIAKDHVRIAKQKNERECVIAQALGDAHPTALAVSVGEYITKIIFKDGSLFRYKTPKALREAVKVYDLSGSWNLPLGVYQLNPPTGSYKLAKEKTDAQRRQTNERWNKYKEKKQINGAGVNMHKSRQLSTREITITRV